MNISILSLTTLAKLCALLIVLLAIVGGVTSFSNVPYWDMWDGFLGFYSHISSGDYSAWWEQHNEHRIVLSNVLFWITFKFFNGHAAFLIVVNYLLVFFSSYLFYLFLSKIIVERHEKVENQGVFLSLVVALLFFWCQKENLTWAFQSQFFLAFNLPLASFYFLSKYLKDKAERDFSLSLLFGLLSVGTMANGILALPLLVLFGLFFKLDLKRLSLILILCVVSWCAYFYDYQSPGHHSSVANSFLHEPVLVIRYIMRYIGSPVYHLMSGGEAAAVFAEVFGGIYILVSIITAITLLKEFPRYQYQSGLLFFILYVGGTATGSAGGRVIFGVGQAFSNRYTTPALMAWVALLILNYYVWNKVYKRLGSKFTYATLFILGIVLIRQFDAAYPNKLVLFERKVAALSVELGVKDEWQVTQSAGRVYPSADALNIIAEDAINKNVSIFGDQYILDSRERIGSEFIPQVNMENCIGALDSIKQVNEKYYVLKGWIFEPKRKISPSKVIFVSGNKVVGIGLVGAPRVDVTKVIDPRALYSGFKGYLIAEVNKGNIKAYSEQEPSCQFNFPEIVVQH